MGRLVVIDTFDTEDRVKEIAEDLNTDYLWTMGKWYLIGDNLHYACYYTKKDKGFYEKEEAHAAVEVLDGNTLEDEFNQTPIIPLYPPGVCIF